MFFPQENGEGCPSKDGRGTFGDGTKAPAIKIWQVVPPREDSKIPWLPGLDIQHGEGKATEPSIDSGEGEWLRMVMHGILYKWLIVVNGS